jgi:hypothetical protein
MKLAWINPQEKVGGFLLHETVEWNAGAFVYERSDGQIVFYHTQSNKIERGGAAVAAKGWAKSWVVEHRGFEHLQDSFEQELVKSKRLRASLMQRKAGSMEKWLKSYGVLIVAYYAIGTLLFHYVEGFAWFDCIYFMTVTATTVGYGDLSPETWQGRLLSIVYMPLGTILTMGGLLQPVGACLGYLNHFNAFIIAKLIVLVNSVIAFMQSKMRWGKWPSSRHAQTTFLTEANQTFTIDKLFGGTLEVGPVLAYTHTILQPIVVALLGCIVTSVVRSKSFIDSLYYGTVTMTTVGYGDSDLLPKDDAEKAYTILFMLFSTTALAVCVERLAMLVTSRRIFIYDFNWELPAMMRKRAIQEGNVSPSLVEDEFVIHVLETYGVIDGDLLKCIRNDFKKIEQFGLHGDSSNGEIEVATLFEHLVARGLVLDSNRVAPESTRASRHRTRQRKGSLGANARKQVEKVTIKGAGPSLPSVMVVDMSTPDKGFQEWHRDIWTPFLECDDEYQQSVARRTSSHDKSDAPRFQVIRGPDDRVSRRPANDDWDDEATPHDDLETIEC